MYKHYITVNANNEVIAAFSNGFQDPQSGDICITPNGTDERHFNPVLVGPYGVYLYTFDGTNMVARSADQVAALVAPIQAKQDILSALAAYDVTVQRSVEDLYAATGSKPVGNTATVIAAKVALRKQLKS